MQCPRCGFDNKPRVKFCNYCGLDFPKGKAPAMRGPSPQTGYASPAPAQSGYPAQPGLPPQPAGYVPGPQRKPFYKQVWVWMLLVIVALGVVVVVFDPLSYLLNDSSSLPPPESRPGDSSQSDDPSAPAGESGQDASPDAGTSQPASQELANLGQVVEPALTPAAPSPDAPSPDDAIDGLNALLANYGEMVELAYDPGTDAFLIELSATGLAGEVALAMEGDELKLQDWGIVTGNIALVCVSSKELVDMAGHTTSTVVVRLINDVNPANTLLLVQDGNILYNVLGDRVKAPEITASPPQSAPEESADEAEGPPV